MSSWPRSARAAALLLLVAWATLACFAWRGGRRALFFLVVPIFFAPALEVGLKLSPMPCGIRSFDDPRVVDRRSEFRWLLPHEVCVLTTVDGGREIDGGPTHEFPLAFGWAALATALVLLRRPGWPARLVLLVATWLVATFLLFL